MCIANEPLGYSDERTKRSIQIVFECYILAGDALLNKLFWKDLGTIISKYWASFEKVLGDKKRLENAMDILNDRPDAHAKPIDAADVALYRRELVWIEERLS